MSSQPNQTLKIELSVNASNPELLQGLEVWLRLGLLNDAQVKRLSRTYLTCLLPEPAVVAKVPESQILPSIDWQTGWEADVPYAEPLTPSPLAQMWHSLRDELSVRWLLFLGVFLVVVSSGVLAATQWRNFPAVGQYGVLWAYTVIFWIGSFWAGKQRSLQLTAQTLRLITLLLVPVNFWAMDSFGLWRNPGEWIVIAIAAFTLTTITLFHQEMRDNSSHLASSATLLLWLSYLHWGWHWSGFPLIAVYLGMVGTAIFMPQRFALSPALTLPTTNESTESPDIKLNSTVGSSIVIYALIVLLGRAIFVIQLPIAQLGLAIGICGWLFARLAQSPELTRESLKAQIWEILGGSLLLIGWLVCWGEKFPWQATAVSGLGLWFCANRLQRFWRRRELLAIFLIGLQGMVLLWRLIPLGLQQQIIAFCTQLTNSQSVPLALTSIGLFPYLIAIVVLIDWLYGADKPRLAGFGEQLTFSFGLVLTFISSVNPILRSLNLILSTITLATVTFRWLPTRTGLVYLTHITGLLSLASVIDWLFPNLNQPTWAGIILVAMVIEWGIGNGKLARQSSPHSRLPTPDSCTDVPPERLYPNSQLPTPNSQLPTPNSQLPTPNSQLWQHSAWHLGFVLSGLSYVLLCNSVYPNGRIATSANQEVGLLWLLTPLALTAVASLTNEPRRQHSAWFSVAALGMVQVLTLPLPETRLISLGIATGLMLVNTRYLQQLAAAIISVGFGLGFVGMLLWNGIPGLPQLIIPDWFLVGAITIMVLWLLGSLLQKRHATLAAFYAQSCDYWAIGLCSYELLMLTLQSVTSYLEVVPTDWKYLAASALISSAIVYRCWKQPHNIGVYSLSWAIELVFAEGILLIGGSPLDLATANIILGLVTLFVSDAWAIRYRRPLPLSSVEILPLLYAFLGIGLRLGYFNSWTGLLTLGAALTGMGVGRRYLEWKPFTYLSLVGISLAWYELVVYQMLQATAASPADGFTILASVAGAIAIFYRLLAWFWHSRTSEPLLSLSVSEIKITAHLHWAIGSSLMLLATINATLTTPRLKVAAIIISIILAGYALLQGRYLEVRENQSSASWIKADSDIWVYLGLIELAVTGIYARLVWTQLSVLDSSRAIIACVLAYGMYQLPWDRWGWSRTPWQSSAIVLPLFAVFATAKVIPDGSLLVVAGFYAWLALRRSHLRFTYISVALIDWAIARGFDRLHLTDILWYTTLFGLSLLFVAQFDPDLKHPQQRELRHYLRLLGSGAICGVALIYHQDTGFIPGFIPGIFSLIALFAGLLLRIRAFLLVGTATFLLTAFYQLVILISRYPFIKWVVGLIVGIIFIGMAANFENRREQIASVLRTSRNQLGDWE